MRLANNLIVPSLPLQDIYLTRLRMGVRSTCVVRLGVRVKFEIKPTVPSSAGRLVQG
jgi:hypothetical protein